MARPANLSKQVYRPINVLSRLEISERRLLLSLGDMFLVLASIAGALALWAWIDQRPLDWILVREQWPWMAVILGSWLLWLPLSDLYDLRISARFGPSFRRILLGGLVVLFIYLVMFFIGSRMIVTGTQVTPDTIIAPDRPPLRLAPVAAVAASIALLLLWRGSYVRLLGAPHARRNMMILGAGRAGQELCKIIHKNQDLHYHLVGFVDDDPRKQHETLFGLPVLGDHGALPELVHMHRIEEVVVAISSELRGSVFQALMDCHEQGVAITPMPILYEELTGKVAVEHIGSQWYVALPLQRRALNTALLVVKRFGDLLFALLLGVVLLALLPFVALLIRLDSPGPIFYSQERVGLHGRRFWLHKFRSMHTNAEAPGAAKWATSDDPRVTRVGKWLRRMRIDELPQIWNVLLGDMSAVGPRPERPEFIEQLQDEIPFYRTRLAVRPGLTGWAQIRHGYGTNLVEDSLTKLQYDLYYLKHQSPWFDLKILARTFLVVLRMQGH